MNPENIYPRTNDHETVYLKNVIKNPNILVGEFTMYNDFVYDPRQFEKNNVLYHYPINHDKLIIGKFCSIACGAKFLFTSANHTQASLSTYPFPIFFEEWGLDIQDITSAWDSVWCYYWGWSNHRYSSRRNKGCAALYDCRRRSRQNNPQTLLG